MKTIIKDLIETVLLALIIFVVMEFAVQNFRVQGSSMEPTLEQGQYLLVNKAVYFQIEPKVVNKFLPFGEIKRHSIFPFHPPKRGEILIFHFPRDNSRDFVKRVVGIPGDRIELHKGIVYINGTELQEPYIKSHDEQSMSPIDVPQGYYFVMGDNRIASNDSRDWGLVPDDKIIGRGWLSYWPISRWSTLRVPPVR